MWETIAIIVTLGGLELTLWLLERQAISRDREMQQKQLEILDGILTELAIQNSNDEADLGGSETENEGTRDKTEHCPEEHSVRH
jgi:hypothetical protein